MATWQEVRAKLHEVRGLADSGELVEAAGGIRTERVQSDKLGSDWVNYYVNDVLVRQEYVDQDVVMGTADNPIAWAAGMLLIPNGFYIHENVRKVWMGAAGVSANWDDTRFAAF